MRGDRLQAGTAAKGASPRESVRFGRLGHVGYRVSGVSERKGGAARRYSDRSEAEPVSTATRSVPAEGHAQRARSSNVCRGNGQLVCWTWSTSSGAELVDLVDVAELVDVAGQVNGRACPTGKRVGR